MKNLRRRIFYSRVGFDYGLNDHVSSKVGIDPLVFDSVEYTEMYKKKSNKNIVLRRRMRCILSTKREDVILQKPVPENCAILKSLKRDIFGSYSEIPFSNEHDNFVGVTVYINRKTQFMPRKRHCGRKSWRIVLLSFYCCYYYYYYFFARFNFKFNVGSSRRITNMIYVPTRWVTLVQSAKVTKADKKCIGLKGCKIWSFIS